MRILDDRHRLFGIVNPVDFVASMFLLVFTITIGVVLFAPVDIARAGDPGAVPVRFTVVCDAVEYWDPSYVSEGDTLSQLGGVPLGTVVAVETQKLSSEGTSAIQAVDVLIAVEGTGIPSEQGIVVGNLQMTNGMLIDISTNRFQSRICQVIDLGAIGQ